MNPDPLQAAYDGKTILVSGAMGYIGSALVHRLSGFDCRIVMASRRGGVGDWESTSSTARIEGMAGDVSQSGFWPHALETSGCDRIFHFAGQNSVYAAAEDPQADFTANVAPVMELAEAIRAGGKIIDVLYSGTATQVGMNANVPDRPVSVYDLHKLMAEQYLELYSRNGYLRSATLRLANVYGPGVTVGSPDRGILNKVITAALNGDPVSIYGNGEFTRDYIYIDDVIEAFVHAGARMEDANGRHYFLGTGEGHLVKDAFTLAAQQAAMAGGKEAVISHVPWPEGLSEIERRNFIADIAPLSRDTGWRPRISLHEGIDKTIAAFTAGEEA